MGDGELMVHFDHVSKRYTRKGYGGSLRDTIPALAGRLVGRRPPAMDVSGGKIGTFWALRDISFALRRGETLGIVGHNGAGKSTILKLLAGVTVPTLGHARVQGRFAALIELGAGFHPDLTGRENVYLNGSILGLKRAEVSRKLESIVEFSGLDNFMNTPVKHYSSGMQARLGFAVAAHVEPDVLLVDEVLSVGDMAFQRKCEEHMFRFRDGGGTIVFVSHNLAAVAALCQNVCLLAKGKVVAYGPSQDVLETYRNLTALDWGTWAASDDALQGSSAGGDDPASGFRITGVRLLNAAGEQQPRFAMGEPIVVEVAYQCHAVVMNPHVGVDVAHLSGSSCGTATMEFDKFEAGRAGRRGRFIARLDPPMLVPGEYMVRVTAAPDPSQVRVFDRHDTTILAVDGPSNVTGRYGIFAMAGQWQHDVEVPSDRASAIAYISAG